jgi:hypothetical protein
MKPHRKGWLLDQDQIALTKRLATLRRTTAAGSGGAFPYLRLRAATNGPYSTSARRRMLTGSHWRLKTVTQRPSLPVRRIMRCRLLSSLFATAALFEATRQSRRLSCGRRLCCMRCFWRYSPLSAVLYFDQSQNDQQNYCADESVDDRANNATSDYNAEMR